MFKLQAVTSQEVAVFLRLCGGHKQLNVLYLESKCPKNEDGRGGGYEIYTLEPFSETYNSEVTGEMTITKLDFENNIVFGTFWFDAINDEGEIVEVREGRFDMQFTQ